MWSASSHLGLARSDLRARGAHGQTRVNTSPPRLHVQLAHCAPRAAERSSDVSKHVRCNAKLATQVATHAGQAAREDDPSTAAAQAVHRVCDVVLHSVVQTTVQARPTEEDVEAQPEVRQPREQSMLPAATSGCGCADLVVLCHWKGGCVEVCGGSVVWCVEVCVRGLWRCVQKELLPSSFCLFQCVTNFGVVELPQLCNLHFHIFVNVSSTEREG